MCESDTAPLEDGVRANVAMQTDYTNLIETMKMCPLEEDAQRDPCDHPVSSIDKNTPCLVKDPNNIERVLRRLHASEGTLMFPTIGGDMKVVLRSDGDAEETAMVFDLGFIVPDDAIAMEQEGSVDETGVYIHQIITVDENPTTEDFEYIRTILNTSYLTKICECSERIIWDNHDICTMCDLCLDTATRDDDRVCVICSEPILTSRGCVIMKCCHQIMHKSCRSRYETDTKKSCPVCRK